MISLCELITLMLGSSQHIHDDEASNQQPVLVRVIPPGKEEEGVEQEEGSWVGEEE